MLPTPATAQSGDPVDDLMARMSVEDKVGQLFLVPFVGAEANPDSDVWQLITEYKVGGVILLAANSNFNNDESAPRQIAELSNTPQNHRVQHQRHPFICSYRPRGRWLSLHSHHAGRIACAQPNGGWRHLGNRQSRSHRPNGW